MNSRRVAVIIDNGLKEQIENYIKAKPDIGLIVIDTFQKIRGSSTNKNAYVSDYAIISKLKTLADKYSIAPIIVHHLRKDTFSVPESLETV